MKILFLNKFLIQDTHLKKTKVVLFDGESALANVKAKNEILKRLNIQIYANPSFKRALAERFVKEFKLRMALHLDLKGRLQECTNNFKKKTQMLLF